MILIFTRKYQACEITLLCATFCEKEIPLCIAIVKINKDEKMSNDEWVVTTNISVLAVVFTAIMLKIFVNVRMIFTLFTACFRSDKRLTTMMENNTTRHIRIMSRASN
jgi:hypothetical protein